VAQCSDAGVQQHVQRVGRERRRFAEGGCATRPPVFTAARRCEDALNSGMMDDDDQYMRRHELNRSILDEMHAPIAYFIGGGSDIAHPNAEKGWQAVQKLDLAAINANMDVGHGATYQMPNGGPFARGPLVWLQWQLKGDAQARAMFVGDGCGFCSGSDWALRRHFPQ
jgi:hypothetical protein